MKKTTKILTFSAAITAAALSFSACRNTEEFYDVYGPPPDPDTDTEISQEVDPSATTFDSSENKNADVYSSPEDSEEIEQ